MVPGVREMVRAYLVVSFLLFVCFLFLYHVFIVNEQELACSTSYGVKKTLIPNNGLLHLVLGTINHPKSIGQILLA